MFDVLTDDPISHVLSYLSNADLARVAQCCIQARSIVTSVRRQTVALMQKSSSVVTAITGNCNLTELHVSILTPTIWESICSQCPRLLKLVVQGCCDALGDMTLPTNHTIQELVIMRNSCSWLYPLTPSATKLRWERGLASDLTQLDNMLPRLESFSLHFAELQDEYWAGAIASFFENRIGSPFNEFYIDCAAECADYNAVEMKDEDRFTEVLGRLRKQILHGTIVAMRRYLYMPISVQVPGVVPPQYSICFYGEVLQTPNNFYATRLELVQSLLECDDLVSHPELSKLWLFTEDGRLIVSQSECALATSLVLSWQTPMPAVQSLRQIVPVCPNLRRIDCSRNSYSRQLTRDYWMHLHGLFPHLRRFSFSVAQHLPEFRGKTTLKFEELTELIVASPTARSCPSTVPPAQTVIVDPKQICAMLQMFPQLRVLHFPTVFTKNCLEALPNLTDLKISRKTEISALKELSRCCPLLRSFEFVDFAYLRDADCEELFNYLMPLSRLRSLCVSNLVVRSSPLRNLLEAVPLQMLGFTYQCQMTAECVPVLCQYATSLQELDLRHCAFPSSDPAIYWKPLTAQLASHRLQSVAFSSESSDTEGKDQRLIVQPDPQYASVEVILVVRRTPVAGISLDAIKPSLR